MNKCDGIKILELDPKRILEGNEYMVIAEKDQNFKAPINQIVDLVVSDDRLKNYIDTTIESSIGDFKNEVNQSISELTSKNGRDFDTGTNITNAPSIPSEIVGWSWGSSENRTQPFLYWGGDNTQSGAECVMVDIKSIQDVYTNDPSLTMPEQLIVQLRGNWFGNKNDGIVTVECTAYKGGVIVKAYQMKGSDMGVTGQSFVFADKDGWVSEEGMPNKIWVGEAVKYVDRWYKINPVDDSVEGMPNLTIQRDFTHKGTLSTSVNGYVTFNGKQYKTWNDQTNVDGGIIIGSVRCLNTDTMTEEGQIKVIAMNENGTIYNDSISTAFRYGYVAGNSEKRGQQFIRSYVSSRDGQAADEEFAVVNYFDKTEAGQVVALNPIT